MPVGGIFTTAACSRAPARSVATSPSRRSVAATARPSGQQNRALDGVLELADVARPVVAHQQLLRVGSSPSIFFFSSARSGEEASSRRHDVVLALAQRRHLDRNDVQAVVEVLAELARLHHRRQIAVGRRDQPHVDAQRARAAEPLELVLLEHAQDLGLRARAHVADFVEEQRAAVGLLEAADALLVGAGERALLVAEQLRLEQVLLQRAQFTLTKLRALRSELW
jgi:hypothetical protein